MNLSNSSLNNNISGVAFGNGAGGGVTTTTFSPEWFNSLPEHRYKHWHRPTTEALFICAYALVIACGSIGNGLVLCAVVRNRRMRTSRNLYIVNLAVSDLILILINCPFTILDFLYQDFVLALNILCKLGNYTQAVNVFLSVLSIAGIALDRFHVIVRQRRQQQQQQTQHYSPSNNNDRRMSTMPPPGGGGDTFFSRISAPVRNHMGLVAIWLLSLVMGLPQLLVRHVVSLESQRGVTSGSGERVYYCMEQWPDDDAHRPRTKSQLQFAVSIVTVLVMYGLPIVCILISYSLIYCQMRRHAARAAARRKRQNTTQQLPLSSTAAGGGGGGGAVAATSTVAGSDGGGEITPTTPHTPILHAATASGINSNGSAMETQKISSDDRQEAPRRQRLHGICCCNRRRRRNSLELSSKESEDLQQKSEEETTGNKTALLSPSRTTTTTTYNCHHHHHHRTRPQQSLLLIAPDSNSTISVGISATATAAAQSSSLAIQNDSNAPPPQASTTTGAAAAAAIAAARQQVDTRRQRKVASLLIGIAVCFIICWLPLTMLNFLLDASVIQVDDPSEIQTVMAWFPVCHLIGVSTAVWNPLLYGWLNDNFRREFNVILQEHFPRLAQLFFSSKKTTTTTTTNNNNNTSNSAVA